jgi:hypothetical protein
MLALNSGVPASLAGWRGRVRRWRRRSGLKARPRAARLILALDCGRLEALLVGGGGETGQLSCNSENIGK